MLERRSGTLCAGMMGRNRAIALRAPQLRFDGGSVDILDTFVNPDTFTIA
ncbi:MAG: hypothetical protein HC871_16545 [Rhizobiales bacterium]|nr:hypothetical protein [Hyphomicrobiales bacterium]